MRIFKCNECMDKLCAKKVPIFSSLTDEELAGVVAKTGHCDYQKGEILCNEGDLGNSLYIVNEGTIKLIKTNRDGKEQIIRILTQGSFFGEYYLFNDDENYNYTAVAIENVKICTLGKADMDEIISANPEITLKILKELSKYLVGMENLIQTLSTNDIEVRLAFILYDFSKKYGEVIDGKTVITLPVSKEEMANYTGVTRETLSRKLSKFSSNNIIELRGNRTIIILDNDKLLKYL
ncbi:MAG: Crp/Fnr family transcriptional regulator [Acidaminobacteraceae bacterium]